jgi:hypothetical protein
MDLSADSTSVFLAMKSEVSLCLFKKGKGRGKKKKQEGIPFDELDESRKISIDKGFTACAVSLWDDVTSQVQNLA